MQTQIDFNGGTNYQTVGNTELISVPYAKYAEVAGSGVNGGVSLDNDSTNELQTLSLQGDTLFLSNSPYVILPQSSGTSLDNDTTNEIQTLTQSGSTITLSNNGGTITVFDGDYNSLVNTPTIPTQTSQLTNNSGFITTEVDGSTTNELQTLSYSNDTLYLTLGGTVYLPTSSVTILDNDSTNELQTISKSGSTITLSDNGGSVTVFDGDYINLTNLPRYLRRLLN